jgi:type VI protein secretion system component VasK
MADPNRHSYRWLSAGALVALALAAFVAVVALRHAASDHTQATDLKARADRTMQRIEAEVDQLENAASAP